MNFTASRKTPNIALSDCGYYRIETTMTGAAPWFTADYLPTQRRLGGSSDKVLAKQFCIDHQKRVAVQKAAITGDHHG